MNEKNAGRDMAREVVRAYSARCVEFWSRGICEDVWLENLVSTLADAVRRNTLEEAAKVAENHPVESRPYGFCNTCGGGPEIAKQIRAIK